MRNYELNIIVDPVLSGDEIKETAQTYINHIKNEGTEIVHVEEMGLRQLAYQIKNRTSGVYYTVEFKAENGTLIDPMELQLRRDERILRFLTVALDKYGVKYNEDKRAGKIGKVKKKEKKEDKNDRRRGGDRRRSNNNRNDRPAPKREAAPKPAAVKDEEE